nr:hypothetical protein HK105_008258 [Polyrhizophydium stewartii]
MSAGSNLADLVPALDLSDHVHGNDGHNGHNDNNHNGNRMSDQRGESELPLGSVMQRIDALVARAGPDWLVPLVLCAIVYVPGIAVSFAAPIGTAGLGFALLFAPVGTLLRYALSRFNSAVPGFPMGTFTVNTVGSAMLFLLFTLRGVVGGTGSPMVCALLVGLSDGLCGCLTTISTFAMELQRLPTRQAYIYFVASVASALMLGIVLTGSWLWANPDGAVLGVCSA